MLKKKRILYIYYIIYIKNIILIDIEISSDDSDLKDSDEEHSNEENSDEENSNEES